MKKLLTTLIGILYAVISMAQIVYKNDKPFSFNRDIPFQTNKYTYTLPKINIDRYKKEDTKLGKDVAERFAAPVEVKINSKEFGEWINLPNGAKLWRLKVTSHDAKNLNFQFSQFKLPKGAIFHIYSEDKSDVRGAFTSQNNREDNTFAIYLIKGESVILEYYAPYNTTNDPKIEIKRILHGYKTADTFNSSGSCNNNINCPIGADWTDEKRAVAMVISGGLGGARWCSGAMVNNVRQDGTPYFLTATHCLTGGENNWAFIYNYESPNCTNIDGSLSESVVGATLLAADGPSDFALLILDNSPPPSYNTYHAGWDANDVVKDSVVGIHHPRGDIKKISFDYDQVVESSYYGPGDDHWQVVNWEDGTTEPVSSGSPLFDSHHRIIGQLHGGDASCGNTDEDYYGKFSFSWNEGASASRRLKDWLDHDNTGTAVLNGNDFNIPVHTIDAAASFIGDLEDKCDTNIRGIEIYFKNLGSDTILKLDILTYLDGDSLEYTTWTGALPFGTGAYHVLSDFTVDEGIHEFKVIVTNPNDSTDKYPLNDTLITSFSVKNGNIITVNINTDFYGEETGLLIFDGTSTKIYEEIGFADNSTVNVPVCLPDGCYTLKITDSFNDGIAGENIFLLHEGNTFDTLSGNFNTETSTNFCVCEGKIYKNSSGIDCDKRVGIKQLLKKENVRIYPNPTSGLVEIETSFDWKNINVLDVYGKEILNIKSTKNDSLGIQINLSEHPKGIYFIQFSIEDNNFVKKIILE